MVMVPDPLTFRMLPWSPGTGWLLCDLRFTTGTPVPLCTRGLLRSVLEQTDGLTYRTGLEVEFHLFRPTDPRLGSGDLGQPGAAPEVGMLNHGYQYLSELRYDELDPILDVLRANIEGLGLPLRSLEVEFGPSQVELTLQPADGLGTADAMVLLRGAVKQVAARHGHHATFMCRPHLPGVFSSGWHLHQSVLRDGVGIFAPDAAEGDGVRPPLSPYGTAFLGGLLRHARATSAFSTPTLNGFKRFRSLSLAPDRAVWGATTEARWCESWVTDRHRPDWRTESANRRPTPTSTSPPNSPPDWTEWRTARTPARRRTCRTPPTPSHCHARSARH